MRRSSNDRLQSTIQRVLVLKRVLLGIIAIGSGQILNATSNIVLMPLFLRSWSAVVYGEWLTLSAIAAYAAIADLGMNSAAVNSITEAYTSGDRARFRMLQASAVAWYSILAVAITLLAALLCFLVPVRSLLAISHIPSSEATWTAWLLAVRVGWQLPLNQLRTVYRNTGNIAASEWILNCQSLLGILFTVGGLSYGVSPVVIALLNLAPMCIVCIILIGCLRTSPHQLMPQMRYARFSGIREMRKPTMAFGAAMLATLIIQQAPIIIVTRTLGASHTVVFTAARTLSNVVRQMTMTVGFALWPEITRLSALRAVSRLRAYHRLYCLLSVALGCVFGAVLWFQGDEIVRIWTRNTLIVDRNVLRGFVVLVVAQGTWASSALLVTAANRPGVLAISTTVSAVVGICVGVCLVGPFGLLGLPIGLLAGDMAACLHPVTRKACTMIAEPYQVYVLGVLKAVILFATVCYACGWIASALLSHQSLLMRLAGVSLSTSIVTVALAWSVSLTYDERQLVGRYVGSGLFSFGKWRLRNAGSDCEA